MTESKMELRRKMQRASALLKRARRRCRQANAQREKASRIMAEADALFRLAVELDAEADALVEQAREVDAAGCATVRRRTCLRCEAQFISPSPYNRICPTCSEHPVRAGLEGRIARVAFDELNESSAQEE